MQQFVDTPTDAELKKFWEWCGFAYRESKCTVMGKAYFHPLDDGIGYSILPDLDLNNLFKYAVPKLDKFYSLTFGKVASSDKWAAELTVIINHEKTICLEAGNNPALALFWAIYKLIENNGENPELVKEVK